jgi:hypothetical protein
MGFRSVSSAITLLVSTMTCHNGDLGIVSDAAVVMEFMFAVQPEAATAALAACEGLHAIVYALRAPPESLVPSTFLGADFESRSVASCLLTKSLCRIISTSLLCSSRRWLQGKMGFGLPSRWEAAGALVALLATLRRYIPTDMDVFEPERPTSSLDTPQIRLALTDTVTHTLASSQPSSRLASGSGSQHASSTSPRHGAVDIASAPIFSLSDGRGVAAAVSATEEAVLMVTIDAAIKALLSLIRGLSCFRRSALKATDSVEVGHLLRLHAERLHVAARRFDAGGMNTGSQRRFGLRLLASPVPQIAVHQFENVILDPPEFEACACRALQAATAFPLAVGLDRVPNRVANHTLCVSAGDCCGCLPCTTCAVQ